MVKVKGIVYMDINKLTKKAQEAVFEANNLALKLNNQSIDVEHLHFALLSQKDSLISKILIKMNVPVDFYYKDLSDELSKLPKIYGSNANVIVTRRFEEIFIQAEEIADKFKDEFVSVEHIYLAIMEERNSMSSNIIKKYGITKEKFLKELSTIRKNQRITSQNPEETYEALERFGRDLVEEANRGKLDPVIGRDAEIRRIIRILSREQK